jgi:hypothetical protein
VPVSIDLRNADGSPRYVKVVNGKAMTCGNASQAGCQRRAASGSSRGRRDIVRCYHAIRGQCDDAPRLARASAERRGS